jgi:hypothetical protein
MCFKFIPWSIPFQQFGNESKQLGLKKKEKERKKERKKERARELDILE